jgi:predicted DNA binding protein
MYLEKAIEKVSRFYQWHRQKIVEVQGNLSTTGGTIFRGAYSKGGVNKTGDNKSSIGFTNEEEVNQILDKIAQVGYQNLTDKEREVLFKASKE